MDQYLPKDLINIVDEYCMCKQYSQLLQDLTSNNRITWLRNDRLNVAYWTNCNRAKAIRKQYGINLRQRTRNDDK